MAAPVAESVSADSDTSSDTLTLNKPSGTVEGDLLVCFLDAIDGSDISSDTFSSTGWTVKGHSDYHPGDYVTDGVLYKVAGASEPSSYDFVFTTTPNGIWGVLVRISGADTAGTPVPVLQWANDAAGSLPNPPASGSVTEGDYLALAVVSDYTYTTHSPPSGYTELADGYVSAASRELTGVTSEDPGTFGGSTTYWLCSTVLIAGLAGDLTHAMPSDDVTTTGWSSTPLWSKIDDDPDSPDATVITATAS
jgi:hypothetical protein